MKNVMTITGIRPDFIRMSEILKKFDYNFNHILVHTGQHYDKMMSDVFFDELEIRKPNYNLEIGGSGKYHYHQLAEVSVKIIDLVKNENLNPDIIIFLGDSNSVLASIPLKKEGFRIGHIEAGMRSYDESMLEETNRVVCDHCSSLLFVYHEDYKQNCLKENITNDKVYVVGNTIVEVCNKLKTNIFSKPKKKDFILMDIHRPENFNFKDRMMNILNMASRFSFIYGVPVKMLRFPRTISKIKEFDLHISDRIDMVDLMSYKDFLQCQYDSLFMFSDSGTAQEEPSLLDTFVIVPRDFTERPQSMINHCSELVNVSCASNCEDVLDKLNNSLKGITKINSSWLGCGKTSELICDLIKSEIGKI